MASMGLLGAIKGGTSAFGNYLNDELKQQRKVAFEELQTENRRETNTQNNQQRHDFRLTELGKADEMARSRTKDAFDMEQSAQPTFTPGTVDIDGRVYDGQYNDQSGEFEQFSTSRGGNRSGYGDLPADAKMIEYLTKIQGMDPESARNWIKTSTAAGPDALFNGLIELGAKDGGDPADAIRKANDLFRGTTHGAFWGQFNYSDVIAFKRNNPNKTDEEIRAYMDHLSKNGQPVSGLQPPPSGTP